MKKKRVVLVAAVLVAGGLGLWVAVQSQQRVTRENCERLRVGMSRADVLAILGEPGDYSTRPGFHEGKRGVLAGRHFLFSQGEYWLGDDLDIEVWFDEQDDVVVEVNPLQVEQLRIHPALLLLYRLELAWRRLTDGR